MHKTNRNYKPANKIFKIILIFFAYILAVSTSVNAGPIEDLQPGHWLEIPGTNLSQVYPSPIIARGNSGPRSIMRTWSGGAYDTKRDRLIVMGGGHLDYGGNELYAFNINTLTWERLTEPSNPAPKCKNYMPDGRPGTSHTYNSLQYSPNTDSFIRAAGAFWGSACSTEMYQLRAITTDIFDFSSSEWRIGALLPEDSAGGPTGRISAVDPVTGNIWVKGSGDSQLLEYSPVNDEWKIRSPEKYLEIYSTAAIDPVRRLMVTVGGYNSSRQIFVWDLTEDYAAAIIPNTTGDTDLEFGRSNGFVFDPTINKFVGWIDGSAVYILDPDTWEWKKVEAAASNVVFPSKESRGTNGRFRYIPSKDVYILVNRTTGNVYFYRLPDVL